MRTQRTVKYSSPFFDSCRRGDLSEIKRLLSLREAFINDRDVYGHTAISLSIRHGQHNVLTFLKEHDAIEQLQERSMGVALGSFDGHLLHSLDHLHQSLQLLTPRDECNPTWFLDVSLTTRRAR